MAPSVGGAVSQLWIGETPNPAPLLADYPDMASIASVNTASTQASQAVQAAQANAATGMNQAQTAPSGLPPVNLAGAASTNTLNAQLVSSQWGIDPAAVGGVYGGAAASDGGLFSGTSLLPLLTSLTRANAEQALSLIGVKTPTPGAAATSTTAAANDAATTVPSTTALDQAATSSSAPMVVDPLWGRSA